MTGCVCAYDNTAATSPQWYDGSCSPAVASNLCSGRSGYPSHNYPYTVTAFCARGGSGPSGITLTDVRASLDYVECTSPQGTNQVLTCTATCPAGKKVTGGSCYAHTVSSPSPVPSGGVLSSTKDAWICSSNVAGSVQYVLTGTAICL